MRQYLIYFVRWVLLLLDPKAFDTSFKCTDDFKVIHTYPDVHRLKYRFYADPFKTMDSQLMQAKYAMTDKLTDFIEVFAIDDSLANQSKEVELRLTIAIIPEKN
jgi:hypothetical protein